MKQLKTLLCMLVCVALLGGCKLPFPLLGNDANVYSASKYTQEIKNNWQYNTLTDEEKTCYSQLYTAVMDTAEQEATVTHTDDDNQPKELIGVQVTFPKAQLTQAQIVRIFEAFYRDNPQFFYLDRVYWMEGRNVLKGQQVYDTILLQYNLDTSQRKTAIQTFTATADAVLSDLPQTEDDYIIEKYIHDRVAALCVYDEEAAAAEAEFYPDAYTAYGALVEGKAVCEGYAKAFQYLLHRAGLPATVVVGTSLSNTEDHMWNLVTVNGENYFVDPTWNDIQNRVQYTFFNLTTEMLSSTHTIDKEQMAVTECTATADNYFFRNHTYIDTYTRDTIAKRIAARINAGDQVIQLKFEKNKFSNGLLFLKNRPLVENLVTPYLTDGNHLWEYDLFSNPEQCVLSLFKKDSDKP